MAAASHKDIETPAIHLHREPYKIARALGIMDLNTHGPQITRYRRVEDEADSIGRVDV